MMRSDAVYRTLFTAAVLTKASDYDNGSRLFSTGLAATHSEVAAWLAEGHLNGGHALDLGCGRGRNALFLAKNGFDVHACDADESAIKLLDNIIAAEKMTNIETDVYDINRAVIQSTYDVIVSTVVLQFLQSERINDVIRNMQSQTAVGGWNIVVSARQTEGLDLSLLPPSFRFFFAENELRDYYQDWNIVKYNEDIGALHRTDAAGNPIQLHFATLWAQKTA